MTASERIYLGVKLLKDVYNQFECEIRSHSGPENHKSLRISSGGYPADIRWISSGYTADIHWRDL